MNSATSALILKISLATSRVLGILVAILALLLLFQKMLQTAWLKLQTRLRAELAQALDQYLETWDAQYRARLEGLRFWEAWILKPLLIERSEEARAWRARALEELYEVSGFFNSDIRDLKHSWLWWKRAAAAHNLGQMRIRRAKGHLINALRDPHTEVRLEATWALGHMHFVDTLPHIMKSMSQFFKVAALRMDAFIFELGKPALPILLELCRHPEQEIRLLAVHLVGEFKDKDALNTLLDMLGSPDAEIRLASGKALGAIGDPKGLEALIEFMKDPHWAMRAQVAKQLGHNGHSGAIPELLKGLEDREWWVRFNSGEALSKLGKPGELALEHAAKNSTDRFARDMAHQWLDEMRATS